MYHIHMNLFQVGVVNDTESRWFNIFGTFFLVVQIIITSALIFNPETRVYLVWMCNNFSFFLAIACYLKKMQLVKGVSYVGLVAQLLWVFDFFSPYFGVNLSSIADYVMLDGFTYTNIVSVLVHVCIPVIVLLLSFRIRPEPRSLLYALPYVAFLFAITIAFTPVEQDVNCVFSACAAGDEPLLQLPYHISLWPLYAMISTFIGYVIHWALYSGWHYVMQGRIHIKI
jgi:hypothetical protein